MNSSTAIPVWDGMHMELPIVAIPTYVEELSTEFSDLFDQQRQFDHFKRLMTAFPMAEKCTIAHMNGLFTEHTNQSNLNRFITAPNWDIDQLNKRRFKIINEVEGDGTVIIDDLITEKYGKEIYGVGWHRDHSNGRNVWGVQMADCVLSGKGIYPLLSSVYLKKNSRWLDGDMVFKTKIEIQKDHLTYLVNKGLKFSYVAMDTWYFCKVLTDHIESLGKDWIAQAKSNRLVWYHGKWIPLRDFALEMFKKYNFRIVDIDKDRYQMKAFSVRMKDMGTVRLLVSLNKHDNFKFYVTNRTDWNEVVIAKHYCPRWDIEVWHREGKGNYGIEDCLLRSRRRVETYTTLSSLAVNFLEISSMLSPVYASLKKQGYTPEMKHRWVAAELVGKLILSVGGVCDMEVRKIVEGLLCPYKSTKVKREAS